MQKRMVLLALVFALVLLSGCTETTVSVAPELKEPVGVQSDMEAAYIGDIYTIDHYDGAVVPHVEELGFEVDGNIAKLNVYPGKWVEEGEVLIELDQSDVVERVESIRKELKYLEQSYAYSDALAELDIQIAEVELKQMREQGADKVQLELKENEIAQKRASLRQAQEQRIPDLRVREEELEKLESSLDKNVLVAPFSGRIVYGLELAEGSWVQAYDTLFYLADDSRLKLTSEYVSDSKYKGAYRMYARIGSEEYEIAPMEVDEDKYISATLSGKELDTWYEILGPADKMDLLEAGQYAAICIVPKYQADVLLVPSGAIYRDASGEYVYVNEDGERVKRPVEVGMTTAALAEITAGLEEGEVVYVKD